MNEYTQSKIRQAELDQDVEDILQSIFEERNDLDEYFIRKDNDLCLQQIMNKN